MPQQPKPTDDDLAPRRDPKDRPLRDDKRISLYPLTTEEALRGLMAAGPHPKDDKPELTEGKEKAPRQSRRGQPISEDTGVDSD
jgi:hypothetical protein